MAIDGIHDGEAMSRNHRPALIALGAFPVAAALDAAATTVTAVAVAGQWKSRLKAADPVRTIGATIDPHYWR